MRNLVYSTVTNNLLTIIDASTNEKLVKHVDLWQTAITEPDYEVSFPVPAVFIEFLPSGWKMLSGSRQVCEAQFRLHVVTYDAGQPTQAALQGFGLADVFVDLLSECQLPNRGRFQRIESLTNHESAKVKDCMETFKIMI